MRAGGESLTGLRGALASTLGPLAAISFLAACSQELGAASDTPPVASGVAASTVSALGRLEPKDGLIVVAGPSEAVVVVERLEVAEGDRVEVGQVLAVLDSLPSREAELERERAELRTAEAEYQRSHSVVGGAVSESQRDEWRRRLAVAQANVKRAESRVARSLVRSPIEGQVIKVNTYPGERVGESGILELGKTQEMYAIAEVYETDIGKVRVGQRASVTSEALPKQLYGTVEQIALRVGKADVLDVDPAARTDARVVEVEIRLDESELVAGLTNLQVEIELGIE